MKGQMSGLAEADVEGETVQENRLIAMIDQSRNGLTADHPR
jgi:hypothetical protein